jgi:hypothetical protein
MVAIRGVQTFLAGYPAVSAYALYDCCIDARLAVAI